MDEKEVVGMELDEGVEPTEEEIKAAMNASSIFFVVSMSTDFGSSA